MYVIFSSFYFMYSILLFYLFYFYFIYSIKTLILFILFFSVIFYSKSFCVVTSTVNNVGMICSDHFAYFLEIPDAEQVRCLFFILEDMIYLNWNLL